MIVAKTVLTFILSINLASAGCLAEYIQSINPKAPAHRIEAAVLQAVKPISAEHPYRVHPYVIMAIIKNESHFKPDVGKNYVGAHGLMQIKRRWHEQSLVKAMMYTDSLDLDNIETNVMTGTEAYRNMIREAKGNRALAVAYYSQNRNQRDVLGASKGYRLRMERTISDLMRVCGGPMPPRYV